MNSYIQIKRMSEEDYETEFGNTPRPGMNRDEAVQRLQDAQNAVEMFNFAQAAKDAAKMTKRKRTPRSRTFYKISASHQVKHAFDILEKENEKIPDQSRRMSRQDIDLLKKAIYQFRMRLIVQDSKSYNDLKQEYAKAQKDESEAELAMKNISATKENLQKYLEFKDHHEDAMCWKMNVSKELDRIKPKYNPKTGKMDLPGVASQNAHIPESTGFLLRIILSPETIRRKFISLETLTHKIRDEVASFISDSQRHKDRAEVVKQIKDEMKKNRTQKN